MKYIHEETVHNLKNGISWRGKILEIIKSQKCG